MGLMIFVLELFASELGNQARVEVVNLAEDPFAGTLCFSRSAIGLMSYLLKPFARRGLKWG